MSWGDWLELMANGEVQLWRAWVACGAFFVAGLITARAPKERTL